MTMGGMMRKIARERDRAFEDFVRTGRWGRVRKYCAKYGVKMPVNECVAAAGIYKAVQECSGISDEIKALARERCEALGFKPTMWG